MIERRQLIEVPYVSEHDTWISIDPIVGCPAKCTYCYLGPLGLRARRPEIRITPALLASKLRNYLAERGSKDSYMRLAHTPVCFGNYTDTFMSRENIEYFLKYAKIHAANFPDHPLCVVTKARLEATDLRRLDSLQHMIIVFLSQSFLDRPGIGIIERGPTSKPTDTVENIRMISALCNIRAVHFLRPATRRAVPSLTRALEVLREVRDAGCLATVTVGLKVGPGVKLTESELLDLLGEESKAIPGCSEVFPQDVRENLLGAARALDYPVYFHTSCAVALARGRAEMLGTWREPVRATRCLPVQCPAAQRELCDTARMRADDPSQAEVARLALRFRLPEGSLHWSESESAFRLERPVRQYTFNTLVHALPYRIVGSDVKPDEAWLGPFAEDNGLSDDCGQWDPDEPLAPRPNIVGANMLRAIQRLYRITGFVTTLHAPNDPRPLAFARYFHVRRVAWVADWLQSLMKNSHSEAVSWLAWSHDINRWPFAHNSERGVFDQAGDISRYLSDHGISPLNRDIFCNPYGSPPQPDLLSDLQGIISKRIDGLSTAGRTVLLADMIAGFIEDPLLAITGLDLSPRLVPDEVRQALVLPLDDEKFRSELAALNVLLYDDHDVKKFMLGFDAIFRRCIRVFARKYRIGEDNPLGRGWFNELRNLVKEEFLKGVLFPYNNEKVAHGSLLKAELVEPLLEVLGQQAAAKLTEVDETGMLKLAVQHGIRGAEEQNRYLPDLDYMANHEPENSFRCTYWRALAPSRRTNG
jgi:DNA repair photolyase